MRHAKTVRRAWNDYERATQPHAILLAPLKSAFYAGAAWMSGHITRETLKAGADIADQLKLNSSKEFMEELREKSKPDFLAICAERDPEQSPAPTFEVNGETYVGEEGYMMGGKK